MEAGELPYCIHYLLDIFLELGEAMVTDVVSPLTWTELLAWSTLTGEDLSPMEAKELINLSRVYVAQYYESRDPLCPAPIRGDTATVTRKLEAFVASLRKVKKLNEGGG